MAHICMLYIRQRGATRVPYVAKEQMRETITEPSDVI